MIIRFIKRILGYYEPGYEYWVNIHDIKIPNEYKNSWIREKKWKHKMKYYLNTGKLDSKIILDKDFNLVDGFSSVKIAYIKGIDKVPVYFIE